MTSPLRVVLLIVDCCGWEVWMSRLAMCSYACGTRCDPYTIVFIGIIEDYPRSSYELALSSTAMSVVSLVPN